MSTDLVTIDEPIVLKSYDDIIERKVTVIFLKMLPEREMFKLAPSGSKERMIYDLSIAIDAKPEIALALSQDALNQKYAVVGRPFMADNLALAMLEIYNVPSARAYVAPDVDARKYTNVFALNSDLEGSNNLAVVQRM